MVIFLLNSSYAQLTQPPLPLNTIKLRSPKHVLGGGGSTGVVQNVFWTP